MTLSHARSGGLLALAAAVTGLALSGGVSTAHAACPRDQICEPTPLPDLVMVKSPTADPSHVTIKNIGNAPAGAFTVKIAAASGKSAEIRRWISGLAAGASTTFTVTPICETARAVLVDSDKTVTERDEYNNSGLLPGKVC
jgi:hypothetical protein